MDNYNFQVMTTGQLKDLLIEYATGKNLFLEVQIIWEILEERLTETEYNNFEDLIQELN